MNRLEGAKACIQAAGQGWTSGQLRFQGSMRRWPNWVSRRLRQVLIGDDLSDDIGDAQAVGIPGILLRSTPCSAG
ncbi:MAG: hypothetical protein Q8N89_15170 [Azonexus sp.]|nr:hypothetical protein [Azonexus sp.]